MYLAEAMHCPMHPGVRGGGGAVSPLNSAGPTGHRSARGESRLPPRRALLVRAPPALSS